MFHFFDHPLIHAVKTWDDPWTYSSPPPITMLRMVFQFTGIPNLIQKQIDQSITGICRYLSTDGSVLIRVSPRLAGILLFWQSLDKNSNGFQVSLYICIICSAFCLFPPQCVSLSMFWYVTILPNIVNQLTNEVRIMFDIHYVQCFLQKLSPEKKLLR